MLRKLASETAVYGMSSILGRFLNYLLVPIHTAMFFPKEYGTITELYAYAGFLIVLFTHGMETAYFNKARVQGEEPKAYKSAFGSVLLLSALGALVLILFSAPLGSSIGPEVKPEYIIYFALVLFFDAASALPFAKLRFQERPWVFASIRFVSILLNIGITFFYLGPGYMLKEWGVLLPWNFYDPNLGVAYVFIANVAGSGAMFLAILFTNKIKIGLNKKILNEMVPYALPMMIAGFAGIINESLDRAMMKWLIPGDSLSQVGIYGACYKLAILMTLFTQAYRFAAEPFFFKTAEEEGSELKFAKAAKYFTIAGTAIFMMVMMYLDLFKGFIHENYHEGLHIVPILLMANLFLGLYYNTSVWYKMTNNTRWGAYIGILGALVTIILNLALVPIMGYTGAAWATLACYAFMLLTSWYAGRRYMPIPYELDKILGYILLAWGAYQLSNYLHGISVMSPMLINSLIMSGFLLIIYLAEKYSAHKIQKSNNP